MVLLLVKVQFDSVYEVNLNFRLIHLVVRGLFGLKALNFVIIEVSKAISERLRLFFVDTRLLDDPASWLVKELLGGVVVAADVDLLVTVFRETSLLET